MEWNTHNNNRNINSKSIQKRRCFTNKRVFTTGNKNNHFLKVTPVQSPDKGNMAAVPVPTPHGIQEMENFQFWHSFFPAESTSPAMVHIIWNKQLGHTHTALKSPPLLPVTRTETSIENRNKKSYGNAHHSVKIINKLFDI